MSLMCIINQPFFENYNSKILVDRHFEYTYTFTNIDFIEDCGRKVSAKRKEHASPLLSISGSFLYHDTVFYLLMLSHCF